MAEQYQGPISWKMVTHFCILAYTIFQQYKKKVFASGIHLKMLALFFIPSLCWRWLMFLEWCISVVSLDTMANMGADTTVVSKDVTNKQVVTTTTLLSSCPETTLLRAVIMATSVVQQCLHACLLSILTTSKKFFLLQMMQNINSADSKLESLSWVYS